MIDNRARALSTINDSQLEGIQSKIEGLGSASQYVDNSYETVDISNVTIGAFWDTDDNEITTSGDTTFRAVPEIAVTAGEKYIIDGRSQLRCNVYIIVDVNGNDLEIFPNTNTSVVDYYNKDFVIPTGGVGLRVNDKNGLTVLKKYTGTIARTLKLGIVGDSLSDRENGITPNQWDNWLESLDGYEINNVALGGTGYLRGTTDFMAQALLLDADCDIVVVFGSFNDRYDLEPTGLIPLGTIGDATDASGYGAMSITVANIRTTCPNAKILMVTPTPWSGLKPYDGAAEPHVLYAEAIIESAKYWGCGYLDLFKTSSMQPWNTTFKNKYYWKSDGTHPNGYGHKEFIYKPMKKAIESLR